MMKRRRPELVWRGPAVTRYEIDFFSPQLNHHISICKGRGRGHLHGEAGGGDLVSRGDHPEEADRLGQGVRVLCPLRKPQPEAGRVGAQGQGHDQL